MQNVCGILTTGGNQRRSPDTLDAFPLLNSTTRTGHDLAGRWAFYWGSRGREFESPQPDTKEQVIRGYELLVSPEDLTDVRRFREKDGDSSWISEH